MGHKEWKENGKIFTRCYIIALKFWGKFNANFVLLYFSSSRSVKVWHLYFKNVKKKNNSVLRHQNIFNMKKHLVLVLKKNVCALFCVFQTNLNKAVDTLCKLSEWTRNIKMIQCFNTIKAWMRIFHG